MIERADSRIVALDGVRGLAAAIVVFGHCLCVTQATASAFPFLLRTPFALLINGPGAIQVFFVLSGFVLAGSLARTSGSHVRLRFLVRRAFRIYPPYWLALFLSWFASFHYLVPLPRDGFTPWIAYLASVHLSFADVRFCLRFPSDAGGLIPVGWTLSVETVFSVIFPILFLIAVRVHWLLLIAASLAAIFTSFARFGLVFALGFSVGIALYCERDFIRSFFTADSPARLALWLTVSVLLFLTPSLFFPFTTLNGFVMFGWPQWSLILLVLGAAGIVAATIGSQETARVLAAKPIAFLGRISYSLYLLHLPVIILGTRMLSRPVTRLDVVLLPIGVFAVTIGLATVAHATVETPAIRLGAWVARQFERGSSTGSRSH